MLEVKSKKTRIDFPVKHTVFRPIVSESADSALKLQKNKKQASLADMTLHEAVHLIEGHETDERFEMAWKTIEKRLDKTKDNEERATCYYYLLRLLLRERPLFENKQAKDLYQNMLENLLLTEKNYKRELVKTKDQTEKQIVNSQIEAFYQLSDSYFTTLEKIYQKRGFIEAKERTYENRMYFRKRFARFSGKHFKHLGHFFLDKTSRYGHSFGRWGITVMVFITIFAGIFALLDWASGTSMFEYYHGGPSLINYFYFSVVTFTTLGYGDIVPVTTPEKFVVGIEVLLGFIMLGVFINLIKKKF